MLDVLYDMKGFDDDVYTFSCGKDKRDILFKSIKYKDRGEKVGGSHMGDSYDIILMKANRKERRFENIEQWDAILGCPLQYMSHISSLGLCGIIARRTTTSPPFVQNLLDNFYQHCYNKH